MSCKIFVVLAAVILLNIINEGSTLKCQQCRYDSNQPIDQQECGGTTVDCSTWYCYSVSYTKSDGVAVVERGCNKNDYCPNPSETCRRQTETYNLRSCAATCCPTNYCNNPFHPTSRSTRRYSTNRFGSTKPPVRIDLGPPNLTSGQCYWLHFHPFCYLHNDDCWLSFPLINCYRVVFSV